MESAVGPNSTSTYSSPPPPPYPNGSDTIPSQVSHSMTDSALSSAAAHGVAIETNNAGIGGAHLDSPPSGYDGGSAQQTRLDTRAMLSSGVSKVSAFKDWSVTHFRINKQRIQERLGQARHTADPTLDQQIADLHDTQVVPYLEHPSRIRNRLLQLHKLVQQQANLFGGALGMHMNFSDALVAFSQRSAEVAAECRFASETAKLVYRHGEHYFAALTALAQALQLLALTTFSDTFETIRVFENTRILYDAARTEFETAQALQTRNPAAQKRLDAATGEYNLQRQKYEKLREDVATKIKFVEEHKNRVLQRQLALLHTATYNYFAGGIHELQTLPTTFATQTGLMVPFVPGSIPSPGGSRTTSASQSPTLGVVRTRTAAGEAQQQHAEGMLRTLETLAVAGASASDTRAAAASSVSPNSQ